MKPLDLVRTPKGAHALVTEVDDRDYAAILVFAGEPRTYERRAWWAPEDGLVAIDSLPRLLAAAASPLGNDENRIAEFFPLSKPRSTQGK